MINRHSIPEILQKIDTLITEYAKICGLQDHIFLWNHLNYEMRIINWKDILRLWGTDIYKLAHTIPDEAISQYVEENHPLYLRVAGMRLQLLDKPDTFKPKDLKLLNDIWNQVQLLKDDSGIKDHVLKTIEDTIKKIEGKAPAHAQQSSSIRVAPLPKYITGATSSSLFIGSQSAYIPPGTLREIVEERFCYRLKLEKL